MHLNASKRRLARSNGMQIPSSERLSWKSRVSLPWGGVLGVCMMVSISLNVLSVTVNKYQFSALDELKKARGMFNDFDIMGLNVGPSTSGDSRRLSGAASGAAHATPSASASHGSMIDTHTGSAYVSCGSAAHASSAGSAGSASHAGAHGKHPQDTLLYLFNALCVGAAVMQLSARFPILQQTIVLFIIGFILSLILKGVKIGGEELQHEIGVWGTSYSMWMEIDPHLLLFTLLPALLAGDAMTIDTSVAKRVAYQCLYLAGPGVLIGAFSTALFLWVYPGTQWKTDNSFMLSLCAGSILCATDPVAVVALLKELGASPMLTVQIQGESLLNDGTAIVLYLISYNILSGQEYDAWDIADFLIEKALMAFVMGLFIGYFFFGWIRAVANKLDHSSGMIQITLTLCAAYWSFIFVEGILGLSGVLATVACSLVLAHHMWPHIVATESMHHVWHTFESLGNIVVFFLAGSITGFIVVDIDPVDFLHLIVIYIVLLTVRASLLFGSRPVLRLLHADKLPVTWQDATLMTWGGLRGAVGLALAIQVNNGRAPMDIRDATNPLIVLSSEPQIDKKDAERLLFFVSGIAFLTTLVNASTAPWLVNKLGITALPQARQTLLKMFHSQLVAWSEDSANPPEVTDSLKHMLTEAAEEIAHQNISKDSTLATQRSSPGDGEKEGAELMGQSATTKCQPNPELLQELEQLSKEYAALPDQDMNLLGSDLPENKMGKVDDMIELLKGEGSFVDLGMAKVVNQCFLTLVYNNYWKLIEEGRLRPGSPECDVLLTSVRISLSPYRADLIDFRYVSEKMLGKEHMNTDDIVGEELGALAENLPQGISKEGCLPSFVNSMGFNLFITLTILANSVMVCIEEVVQTEDNKDNLVWIFMDGLFTFIFTLEAVLKLAWLKQMYFKDAWNRFDFFLVVAGIGGFVMGVMTHGGGAALANQTRIIKLARLMRTMRFLRVFRLFNARMNNDKFVSLELAKHMKKITTMYCYLCAHSMAQIDLVRYFGGNGKIDTKDEAEIARCVLQSVVSCYKALLAAANCQRQISKPILDELTYVYKRKTITEGLTHFVEKAFADGAISANEAHAILHPLNHHVSQCMKIMNDRAEGVIGRDSAEALAKDAPGAGPAAAGAGEAPPAAPATAAPVVTETPVEIPSLIGATA